MASNRAVIVDWVEPELHLYHVADAHVGAVASAEDKQAKLVDIILGDPYARILGGGDYTESIAPSDRRYDPSELADPKPANIHNLFYCQACRFAKIWEPTKGLWDGLVMGNHGATAVNRYYTNTVSIIAERLGTRYVGGTNQCGWFLYRMKDDGGKTRHVITVFVIHGWGGGELRGGDALKMQRLLWRKRADILLMGHMHRPMVFPETVETVDKHGREVTFTSWGVIGFPLIGKHGYIARKGGNESPQGYVRVIIRRRSNFTPEISIELKEL
jgi:hypothetical protein